jgi:mannosyltransferase
VHRRASRAAGWAPSVVLAVLGGVLLLQRRSLWYDELFTAQVGTSGPVALVRAVLTGVGTASYLREVPPSYNAPYYVVVQAWLGLTRLPADEVGLRLLSLCAAVAGVGVLTAAVTRLAGRTSGVLAGLLAATSPMVVEYAAEGRMYGLALLATATAVLGLARWLDDGRLGLWAVGATAAGLAHWFALPVVAGLALAALVLRRRRALPLLAVSAAAVLPTLALVALVQVNGTGDSAVGWIRATGAEVPVLALQAWTGGGAALLAVLLTAVAAGLVLGHRRTAVVAVCWVGVPLAAVTAGELLRPVFVPRYLLPALLGLVVLAAVGLSRLPRLALAGAAGLLVALQLVAVGGVLERGPREDARGAVAGLRERQRPGEAVVAVDRRAALALEQYAGRLRPDVVVPPADPPADEDVVWLLRQSTDEGVRPSDDDAVLRGQGLRLEGSWTYDGTSSDLVLQRWSH